MFIILGECQNFTAAACLYAERYPDWEHHSQTVFQRPATFQVMTNWPGPTRYKQKYIDTSQKRSGCGCLPAV